MVRSDHRLVWRSATEVALTEWEEVATLYDLPLEQAPFVVFDLETTGTRPGVSRIVEIGAVRLQGFEQVGEFERLVDPGVPVPSTITRITGIQTRDLRGAPRIARALPRVPRVRRRARCWSPTTPASTSASSTPSCRGSRAAGWLRR